MPNPAARRVRRRRLPTAIVAVAALIALAGCAAASSVAEEQPMCIGSTQALTELEIAPDPTDVDGPSTACLLDAHVEAVSSTAEPELPVTLTDAQGTNVTVTDASRILPLDIT